MGGTAMMHLRNEAADHIREYMGDYMDEIGRGKYEGNVWVVIEQLLNCLDEQQLENIPKMLAGEDIA